MGALEQDRQECQSIPAQPSTTLEQSDLGQSL